MDAAKEGEPIEEEAETEDGRSEKIENRIVEIEEAEEDEGERCEDDEELGLKAEMEAVKETEIVEKEGCKGGTRGCEGGMEGYEEGAEEKVEKEIEGEAEEEDVGGAEHEKEKDMVTSKGNGCVGRDGIGPCGSVEGHYSRPMMPNRYINQLGLSNREGDNNEGSNQRVGPNNKQRKSNSIEGYTHNISLDQHVGVD